MSDRLMRVLAQLCEAAAWCFATGDDANGAYFLESAARCLTVTDGTQLLFDAPA